MNKTFVMSCWNVTLLCIVMHRLDDWRTSLTGYGSDFQYSLLLMVLRCFFTNLDSVKAIDSPVHCTVISFAFVSIVFTVFRRTVYVGSFNVNC